MTEGSSCLFEYIDRFPLRLPPDEPFVTLSHAISWIVYRHSMPGRNLSAMLGEGEARHTSNATWNAQLDDVVLSSVKRLADCGTIGAIEIRGRFFDSSLTDEIKSFTEQIPLVRLADFRWFDTLDDSLYRGFGLAWGENRREPRYPRDDGHYRFVTVERAGLLREFPPDNAGSRAPAASFTIAEIDDWIRSTPNTGMKLARKSFMAEPCAKGLSATFEARWNAIKQNKPGRPAKK